MKVENIEKLIKRMENNYKYLEFLKLTDKHVSLLKELEELKKGLKVELTEDEYLFLFHNGNIET